MHSLQGNESESDQTIRKIDTDTSNTAQEGKHPLRDITNKPRLYHLNHNYVGLSTMDPMSLSQVSTPSSPGYKPIHGEPSGPNYMETIVEKQYLGVGHDTKGKRKIVCTLDKPS